MRGWRRYAGRLGHDVAQPVIEPVIEPVIKPVIKPVGVSTAIPTPKVVDGSITATDKSFALTVPSGWTSPKRGVPSPFVVALQDQTAPTDQVLISSFASPTDADDAAQRTASGLAAQKVACDPGTVGGRKLIDCHYAYQGKQVRKMLFSFVHDKTSTLVLYQTLAKSRAAGYAKVDPILASWRWADGSGLAKG